VQINNSKLYRKQEDYPLASGIFPFHFILLIYLRELKFKIMKTTDNFSKRFLSICAGVSLVMLSAAAFVFSMQPSQAAEKTGLKSYQVGTAENYIPLGINNGYAYWIIYNTNDGYKFRKANVSSAKWEEK